MSSCMTLLCLTKSTNLLISAGIGVGSVELLPLLSSIIEIYGTSKQFACLDGRMPFFIMHDLNEYLNWERAGLLFQHPRPLIRLKRVSKLPWLISYVRTYRNGSPCCKRRCESLQMDVIVTRKPMNAVLCLPVAVCFFL